MNRYIIFITILLGVVGCSNRQNSNQVVKVNHIPPKKTYVKDDTPSLEELETIEGVEVIDSVQTSTSTTTPLSQPKPLTYKNNFGGDFGYFDRHGYYYNGCYFHYRDGYTYEDRLHRRGHFDPRVRHIRVCGEDYDNGGGYYYPAPDSYTIKNRVAHPEHLEERYIGSGSYSGLTYTGDGN